MQPDFRGGLTFTVSIIALIVLPVLFLYLIFGGRRLARRSTSGALTGDSDWPAELSRRTRSNELRFRFVIAVLFLLGVPLLLLSPRQNPQPENAVADRPPLWKSSPFTFFLFMLPPALVVGGGGVLAYRMFRHYDSGVSRAAKQANAGDLDGAIAELRRQIESKGLSAARANALGCLLTLKEDWHEARRMFDEAESRGMSPNLLRANRAVALWKSGNPEAALPLLAEAALNSPNDINVRCHLCLVLADLGRIDDSRAQLKSIEDLHKKQHTVPAAARQSLEKHIQTCRDRLAEKPQSDLTTLEGA
jgi:tetratricopeptide (TPR) repeat protein